MNNIFRLFVLVSGSIIITILGMSCTVHQENDRVLVFSRTVGGHRHTSIEAGKTMFLRLGERYGYRIDTSENSEDFSRENLSKYQAVVFLSTRGDVLDSAQQEAFKQFIRSGRGFVGIHAATTTEYNWPWYNGLVGAYFDGHPEPQEAIYRVVDTSFPAVRPWAKEFKWYDEIYNFRSVKDSLNYVMLVDPTSFEGGKMGEMHPVSWYHEYEGARSFYTALGHFDETYEDERFVQSVWQGLLWVMYK
jgi:type 1 glutamine amidotransferase